MNATNNNFECENFSVCLICAKTTIYLLLYTWRDCTFKAIIKFFQENAVVQLSGYYIPISLDRYLYEMFVFKIRQPL